MRLAEAGFYKANLIPIIPVPHWIYDHLIRVDRSISDITDYSTLKTVMSGDDIMTLISLDKILGFQDTFNSLVCDIDFDSAIYKELSNLRELAKDPDNKEWLIGKLSSNNMTNPPYELIMGTHKVFIILGSNFMTDIKKTLKNLNLDLVELLYRDAAISEVSQTPIFEAYINSIFEEVLAEQK